MIANRDPVGDHHEDLRKDCLKGVFKGKGMGNSLRQFLTLTWSPEFKGLVGTMRSDMPVTVVLSAQSSWYGSICTCKHCLAGGRGCDRGNVQVTIFLYCQDPIEVCLESSMIGSHYLLHGPMVMTKPT